MRARSSVSFSIVKGRARVLAEVVGPAAECFADGDDEDLARVLSREKVQLDAACPNDSTWDSR